MTSPVESQLSVPNIPTLARSVSSTTHSILKELADECICPISQSLMVDPVIAGDGHTYDRLQIETWFKEQKGKGKVPPTSPQTREPIKDTRLVSNLALRRTIERLINSGRLDADIVSEWHAAVEAVKSSSRSEKREESLARAPIGCKVVLTACLQLVQTPAVEEALLDGSLAFHDMSADLYERINGSGGGLFGAPARKVGRLFVANVPIGAVLRSIDENIAVRQRANGDDDHQDDVLMEIRRCFEEPAPPPLSSRPDETLLASVLPAEADSRDSVVFALEHVVMRLASIEHGLPEGVQAEWNTLENELRRRRRRDRLKKLQGILANGTLFIASVVHDVDDTGTFTLSFPGLYRARVSGEQTGVSASSVENVFASVPSDFIGPGGVVARPGHPSRRRLFGEVDTGGEAVQFGRPRGGLFGGVDTGGETEGVGDNLVITDEGETIGAATSGRLFGATSGGGLFGGTIS